jgi:hypothetical protein
MLADARFSLWQREKNSLCLHPALSGLLLKGGGLRKQDGGFFSQVKKIVATEYFDFRLNYHSLFLPKSEFALQIGSCGNQKNILICLEATLH